MWQIWWFKLKPSWRAISSASLVLYRCCCIQGFSFAAWWEQCFHFDRAADLSINDFPVFQQLEALWFSIFSVSKRAPNKCHSSLNLVSRKLLCFVCTFIDKLWYPFLSFLWGIHVTCHVLWGLKVRTWLRSCWSRRPSGRNLMENCYQSVFFAFKKGLVELGLGYTWGDNEWRKLLTKWVLDVISEFSIQWSFLSSMLCWF